MTEQVSMLTLRLVPYIHQRALILFKRMWDSDGEVHKLHLSLSFTPESQFFACMFSFEKGTPKCSNNWDNCEWG